MRLRKASGIHSAELIAGLMILIPIVLYALDYATVVYGGQMNASACSAACRAAASGPPSGYTPVSANNPNPVNNTPRLRAMTTLAKVAQAGAVIRVKKTVGINEQVLSPIPIVPYGGPFNGTVSVKTRCDVFPPFLLPFIPNQVTLYTEQTYPWTYNMPSTFGGTTNLTFLPPSGSTNDINNPISSSAP
jgi:hypothetical protein